MAAVAHARPEVHVYQWEGVEGQGRAGPGNRGHTGASEVISPCSEKLCDIVERTGPLGLKETWV